jgi:hypothetical protein
MIFGIFAAYTASELLISLMRESVECSVSIPGLLTAAVLPFLLSAFAIGFGEPWLLLIISWVKAFGFGFCACGVSLAFGQCSWLVRPLFLFSDLCVVPMLYFYWLRHIGNEKKSTRWELPAILCASGAVAYLDYCFVAPFLVSIIES